MIKIQPKFTIHNVLHKFNKIHKNKYDYSKFIYKNSHFKGEIICSKHGPFFQSYNTHKKGVGCPKCKGQNKSSAEIVLDFNEIHKNKYDYSEFVYNGSHKKSIIICLVHGKFLQNTSSHLQGHGCSKCGIETASLLKKSSIDDFISTAQKIHGDKYNYSKVNYINSNTKIIIVCPNHGEFFQLPSNHLTGRGCSKCGIEVRGHSRNNTTEKFINMAQKIHGNKYDYSKVNYIKAINKIEIICPNHGNFVQSPNSHLNGSGCPKCGIEKARLSCVKNIRQIIEEFILIHGNKYDYSSVKYYNAIKKVCIICLKHGKFYQSPDKHLRGDQCPKCNTSIGELTIIKFLNDNKIEYIHQKTFDDCRNVKINRVLKYDFFVPSKNILIEYDGEQHFNFGGLLKGKYRITKKELTNLKLRDSIKTEYAMKKNIRLLRIKYTEFKQITKILTTELLN